MGVARVAFKEDPCAVTYSALATFIDPGVTRVVPNVHELHQWRSNRNKKHMQFVEMEEKPSRVSRDESV